MSIADLRRSHNRRHEIAGELADHLTAFETALGTALTHGSRLVGFLPDARAQAEVSAVVGQEAIGHFVSSLGLLAQAMESTVAGHHSLDQTRQHFRIQIKAGGDKDAIPSVAHGGAGEGASAAITARAAQ